MIRIWTIAGRITYILVFPLLAIVIRSTTRTRIIAVNDDKILVVKGWLGNGKWMLPGGGLHKNEQQTSGAKRELLEETNINIKDTSLLHIGKKVYKNGLIKYQYHLFETKLDTFPKDVKKQQIEILELKWVNIDDINPREFSDELIEMVDIWKNKGKFAKIN
jgi:8-oxo-dGTP pyrophosphatase MutT (NUDIX family)